MKGLRTITRRFQQLRALHVARPVSRASDAAIAGKASALALAIKQIEASFGKGSLMQLGAVNAVAQVDVISTGSLAVDHALGIGGLPRGCGTHASPLSFFAHEPTCSLAGRHFIGASWKFSGQSRAARRRSRCT